jgi:anaerobic magnesium-protoporphyrin IX monomethyl ester cyclase
MENILLVNTPPHSDSILSKSKHSKLFGQKGRQIFAYGLLSIGAYLESKGLKVDYEDMWNMDWEQIKESLLSFNPDIIFSSCLTDNRQSNFILSRIAKTLNPDVVNVVGNAHATAMYQQILSNYPEVDYIVLGEGEITCHELIECLKNDGNIKDVKGLAYRVNNTICVTEKRPLANLDEFPFPTKYRLPPDYPDIASLNTSRGCPYGCSYCSLSGYWGGVWRGRSPKKVMEEIEFVVSQGAKRIVFNEDHFTFNRKRAMEIVSGFGKYNFKWSMQCRVDRIDKEMLELFKKNGCEGIIYGTETFSPTVLKNIHKGFTLEQIKNTFKLTKEVGIPCQGNIMIGNIGETQKTINETIQGLKEIKPDSIAKFITMVYPNTPM